MINSRLSKEKGTFTVEFAIVGIIFSLLLVFTGDLVIKLATRGQLDRIAYSSVSLLKERSQLFYQDSDMTQDEAEKIYKIVESSLRRTLGGFDENRFGFIINARRGVDFEFNWTSPDGLASNCTSRDLAGPYTQELGFATSGQNQVTLYQVTLCYDTLDWYGHLLGRDYQRVSTNAIMVGR